MASEKQIAANRRNSLRSSGPKSRLGKYRSSRNAFRHGFSLGLVLDPSNIKRIDSLKKKLIGPHVNKDLDLAVEEFARAQLQILKIRKTQARELAELSKTPDADNIKALRRLAALDRYERYALERVRLNPAHNQRRRRSWRIPAA